MSKKIDKKVLLSPVLAAMLGIAGTAGAGEIPAVEANAPVALTAEVAGPSLELNIDYLGAQAQLDLDEATAGTECTLYTSGGTKCSFYSTEQEERLIAGAYGNGLFDV